MAALSAAASCKAVARSSAAALKVLQTGHHVRQLVPAGTSVASSSAASYPQQKRSISSISSRFSDRKKRSSPPPSSSSSYAALRNMVTSPFQAQNDTSYVSPYSDFFANIEAGRSSLGTTEEMEQKLSNLSVQKLD